MWTVCAKCKTTWWQQVWTIKRVISFACKYSTPFVRTYLSWHRLDTWSCSAFSKSGFKDSSSLCSFEIFSGILQPLASRSSTNVSEAGVPRCFSSSHCRCYFLGPLVPPCNKLLSKSGNDCRPDLTCARVTVGHDRFTMAETVSESLVVSNSSQSIGIQIQLLLPYINLPVSSSVFRHHATHAIAWGPVVQGGFLPMGIVNWHFFLTGA